MAQAEFDVKEAQRAVEVAQRGLGKEIGRMQTNSLRVQGDFNIDDQRQRPDFTSLAQKHPRLRALAAEREAARFALNSAKGELFPEVYAVAKIGKVDSDWPPQREEWSAGVTLSLPIFTGGKRIANISYAKAGLYKAEADEKSGQNEIILKLEQSWTRLQNALDLVAVKRTYLQAYEERAKIARAQYANGLISFDNWTIIEDNLVEAQKSFLSAQATAAVAEAEWIHAQGRTLEDAL